MFSSYGTPPRASATGSLRGRRRAPLYELSAACRSTTDLPGTMAYRLTDEYMPSPPMVTASPPFRSYDISSQRTSYVGTGSPQDLPTKPFMQSPRAAFIPPTPRTSRTHKTKELMQRFLLHNFMFTYGIDTSHFRNYIENATCELLSTNEQTYLASIGRDLQIVYDRVRNNRYSLLGREECVSIVENVIVPAQSLNIEPGYLCEHLMNLPDHEFEREKRDSLHIFSQVTKRSFWSRSRKWDTTDARFHLARCLVSDDCVIERIAPSRHVQYLIGTCIESFDERRCKKGVNMGSINRKVYVAEHTQRMVDAVIAHTQQPAPSPQRRKLVPTSNPLRLAPLSRDPSIPPQAKETPLADVNEVDEDHSRCTP